MAGVGCATALWEAGIQVSIFEKSKVFGGRCATRKLDGLSMDHGAQFFTARSPEFSAKTQAACGLNLQQINAPVLNESGRPIRTNTPRLYHLLGNRQLAADLGHPLAPNFEVEVSHVEEGTGINRGKWGVNGVFFDAVVSTAPWPQTAKIFSLPETKASAYLPCLTVLLLYEGAWLGRSTQRYAVSDHSGHPLYWSACENHKRGRIPPGVTAIVVQASVSFSLEHLESPLEAWAPLLCSLVEERWELPPNARATKHRHLWRYARISKPATLPALPEGLFYAGDALGESRVESAWLSGRKVGSELAQKLSQMQ